MSSTERSSNLVLSVAVVLVLAAMAFLMELLTRRMDTRMKASPQSLAELQLRQLHYAVEAFRVETGRYPRQDEGLEALVRAPEDVRGQWKGPYLTKAELPSDPWSHPYTYRLFGEGRFEVVSLGADGRPGGQGPDADLSSARLGALADQKSGPVPQSTPKPF